MMRKNMFPKPFAFIAALISSLCIFPLNADVNANGIQRIVTITDILLNNQTTESSIAEQRIQSVNITTPGINSSTVQRPLVSDTNLSAKFGNNNKSADSISLQHNDDSQSSTQMSESKTNRNEDSKLNNTLSDMTTRVNSQTSNFSDISSYITSSFHQIPLSSIENHSANADGVARSTSSDNISVTQAAKGNIEETKTPEGKITYTTVTVENVTEAEITEPIFEIKATEQHSVSHDPPYKVHNYNGHTMLVHSHHDAHFSHHLQLVPREDEPFGAVIVKDERYLVSILIPIGIGLIGATIIVVTLYTLRNIARKQGRGYLITDAEQGTQGTSCISSIRSERTDKLILLGGDDDNEV